RRHAGNETRAALRARSLDKGRAGGGGNRQHRGPAGSVFHPTFLPFLAAMSVFLLGMGIVNPLGTAQALSPFGEKAGAASALLGFWQMMGAAIGVYLAATVSHEAMFALGIVVVAASLLALGLYAMRAKAN